MTTAPPLLITIDTEGDNLWGRPRSITTVNARYLPRFQELCSRHGLKPTYLTNYEMAVCPVFTSFAHAAQRDGAAEVGMHLHAWNSPPLDRPLTSDDDGLHPPLIAYPAEVVRAKVDYMTALLEDTFGVDIVSHRAGRWGLDCTYVEALIANGYKVDCSVTPHMHWRYGRLGAARELVVDYRTAPETALPAEPRRRHPTWRLGSAGAADVRGEPGPGTASSPAAELATEVADRPRAGPGVRTACLAAAPAWQPEPHEMAARRGTASRAAATRS